MLAKLPRPTRIALAVSAALCSSQILANPLGGQVISGSATIQSSGNQTTINQSSNRAIINWQSFSIGNGERTHFNQPSASSAVLNRVLGGNPSELLGALSANGKVFIINPNGVLVGAGATINTGAFVGSTRDVSNPQFMAGGNLDFFGSTNASVVNLGTINATSGDVVLLAHTVSNQGTTTATSGTAALASGTELLYVPTGNERIVIKANALKDGGSVSQTGAIAAAQAELKAVGGNPYALAVNAGGTINAVSLDNVGGRIVLNAKSGTTQVSGNMVASQGDKGGEILATGQHVAISETANLNASGAHGGGRIAVGGGYQGKDNDLQNAQTTTVAKGANLLAAATDVGHGGQITVWADGATQYQGHASVRGGANGGDGGLIEVSGKRTLAYSGTVDMRAPRGHNGTLILDPTDITINDDASSGSLMVAGNTSTLTATDIRNALLAGNVVISTSSAGGGSGDITVAAVGNSSAYFFDGTDNTLTLRADRDIAVNQSVRVYNFSPTSTNAGLTLEAGRNLSVNGGTTFLWSNNLTLVADAANAGAGGSTMRFTDGVNLFGDNIRLFVPARGLLTKPSSVSVSSNADTFGKYYGDAGTAAAGIYYKSDRVVLTTVAITPQIRHWVISAQNEQFINASGDSQLIEWLKIYNAAKEKLKQAPEDETANQIATFIQQEILKRLPDDDANQAARVARARLLNDPQVNAWLDEISLLEQQIMKNGRTDSTLQQIALLKSKVDFRFLSDDFGALLTPLLPPSTADILNRPFTLNATQMIPSSTGTEEVARDLQLAINGPYGPLAKLVRIGSHLGPMPQTFKDINDGFAWRTRDVDIRGVAQNLKSIQKTLEDQRQSMRDKAIDLDRKVEELDRKIRETQQKDAGPGGPKDLLNSSFRNNLFDETTESALKELYDQRENLARQKSWAVGQVEKVTGLLSNFTIKSTELLSRFDAIVAQANGN